MAGIEYGCQAATLRKWIYDVLADVAAKDLFVIACDDVCGTMLAVILVAATMAGIVEDERILARCVGHEIVHGLFNIRLRWPAFGALVLFLVRHHDNIRVAVAVDFHEQLLELLDVIHRTGKWARPIVGLGIVWG